MQSTEL